MNNSTLIHNSKMLDSVRVELNAKFLEREQEIECILTALVANCNVQFIAAPGTGKSALGIGVAHLIACSFWKCNMDQDLDPDFVIGHISLKEMRDNDRIWRNTTGKIADGQIIFIDECNKVNSAMKNALLLPLNERQVDIGDGVPRDTEIRTVIGASNEYPGCVDIEDDTDHLRYDPNWDRYLLRMECQYIQKDHNFMHLIRNRHTMGKVDKSKAIPLSVLDEMRAAIYHVDLTPVESLIKKFKDLMTRQSIIASDRRWIAICDLIAAQAVMRGSLTAHQNDCLILKHALWITPDQRADVTKIVLDSVKSEYTSSLKILELVKGGVREALDAARNDDREIEEGRKRKSESKAVSILTTQKELLQKHVQEAGSKNWTEPKALEVKAEIAGLIRSLLEEAQKRMQISVSI